MIFLKIKNKEDLLTLNRNFVLSRLFFISLICLFSLNEGLNNSLLHFDSYHYTSIAFSGYTENMQYAFFPLFPIVIKVFNYLNLGLISIIIFNIFLSYLSTILVYKISKEVYKFKDNIVKNNLYFWLFSPISLFLIIPYTESLFIFLTIFCFYIYKTRNKPILTGIVLGLSVLTRSFGAMLFFAIFISLVVELYKSRGFKIKRLRLFIYIIKMYIPATILSCLYPIYMFIKKGDFLYFINVQFKYWYRVKANVFTAIYSEVVLTFNLKTHLYLRASNLFLTLFSIFIIIFMIYKLIKTKNKDYLLLCLYMTFCFISSFSTMRQDGLVYPTCSVYRYLFSLFPIYLVPKEKLFYKLLELLFLILNIIIIFAYCTENFLC